MKYVTIASGGFVHQIKGNGKTVCGKNYRRYDFIPYNENEIDLRFQTICHKCRNIQRHEPGGVLEAMEQEAQCTTKSH
jgi:hypothetical protein